MTTCVSIDAHAGWDVEVLVQHLDEQKQVKAQTLEIVQKFTVKHFYIHSHMQLGSIKELKKED